MKLIVSIITLLVFASPIASSADPGLDSLLFKRTVEYIRTTGISEYDIRAPIHVDPGLLDRDHPALYVEASDINRENSAVAHRVAILRDLGIATTDVADYVQHCPMNRGLTLPDTGEDTSSHTNHHANDLCSSESPHYVVSTFEQEKTGCDSHITADPNVEWQGSMHGQIVEVTNDSFFAYEICFEWEDGQWGEPQVTVSSGAKN